MSRPTLYYLQIPADLSLDTYHDETTVIAHRFVTRCANQMRRIRVDADFLRLMCTACQVRKSHAEDLIETFLHAGILRMIGACYPYIVDDFIEADFETIDDLEGVTFG